MSDEHLNDSQRNASIAEWAQCNLTLDPAKFPPGWPAHDRRTPLKVKRVHPDAELPKYETEGAACFDLKAVDGGVLQEANGWAGVGLAQTFRTGLAFEVPPGHVLLVFSRSSQGFNADVRLANCVGVIDSDYRGEVKVRLTSDKRDGATYPVTAGDRIAQAMLLPIPSVRLVEVEELTETARGTGGFGSTGV